MEDPLRLLATLAREYQQKYEQLASALRDADPDLVPRQLKMRAELTTDRFRSAQMDFLTHTSIEAADTQGAGYDSLVTLFRSFDEMRILFQLLFDSFSGNTETLR